MDFTNKCVLITGGSRGIGRATAIAFAKAGARVAINYRSNQTAANKTLNTLEGNDHLTIKADISDPESVRQMINEIALKWGQLDVVVNNAGIFEHHPIDLVSYEDWQQSWKKILDLNLIAAANVCYCAAQYMILKKSGSIVNVSSRGAFRGEPDYPAYGASKAGLNALSQSLAISLAKHNISVNVVAPGFVETEMTAAILESPQGEPIKQQSPFGRVARPEEVANTILFLASDEALFTTGTIVDVNGASYLRS